MYKATTNFCPQQVEKTKRPDRRREEEVQLAGFQVPYQDPQDEHSEHQSALATSPTSPWLDKPGHSHTAHPHTAHPQP